MAASSPCWAAFPDVPVDGDLVHRVEVLSPGPANTLTTHRAQPTKAVPDKSCLVVCCEGERTLSAVLALALLLLPVSLILHTEVGVTRELRILPDNLITPWHEIHPSTRVLGLLCLCSAKNGFIIRQILSPNNHLRFKSLWTCFNSSMKPKFCCPRSSLQNSCLSRLLLVSGISVVSGNNYHINSGLC